MGGNKRSQKKHRQVKSYAGSDRDQVRPATPRQQNVGIQKFVALTVLAAMGMYLFCVAAVCILVATGTLTGADAVALLTPITNFFIVALFILGGSAGAAFISKKMKEWGND